MRLLVCLGSLFGACDSGKPPVAPTPAAPPQVIAAAPVDAAVALPDAPDAFLALFERPAVHITKDGALVLLAVVDDDGARGEPNLVFEVRDRKDKTIERVVVLELDKPEPDAAEKARRVAAAEKLFASREWIEMTAMTRSADREEHFEGNGTTIDWKSERIKIARAGKKVVDRAVPTAWRGGSYFLKAEDLTCSNADFLASAYVAGEHPLVVVDVAYRGNDTCWEPTSTLHVVSW